MSGSVQRHKRQTIAKLATFFIKEEYQGELRLIIVVGFPGVRKHQMAVHSTEDNLAMSRHESVIKIP